MFTNRRPPYGLILQRYSPAERVVAREGLGVLCMEGWAPANPSHGTAAWVTRAKVTVGRAVSLDCTPLWGESLREHTLDALLIDYTKKKFSTCKIYLSAFWLFPPTFVKR